MLTTVRRWYVSVPILALAVVASFQLRDRIDTEWEATASALFVTPPPKFDDLGRTIQYGNPFLSGGSNVGTAADSVFRILDRNDHRRQFKELGLAEDYQLFRPNNSPLMDFRVVGNTEQQSLDTIDGLLRSAEVQISIIQQQLNAPPDELITVQAFERTQLPEEGSGNRLRFQVAVILLGMAAAAAAAILTESILGRLTGESAGGADQHAGRGPPEGNGGSDDDRWNGGPDRDGLLRPVPTNPTDPDGSPTFDPDLEPIDATLRSEGEGVPLVPVLAEEPGDPRSARSRERTRSTDRQDSAATPSAATNERNKARTGGAKTTAKAKTSDKDDTDASEAKSTAAKVIAGRAKAEPGTDGRSSGEAKPDMARGDKKSARTAKSGDSGKKRNTRSTQAQQGRSKREDGGNGGHGRN